MTISDIIAIIPLLIIAFGIVLQLVLIAWRRSQVTISMMTLAILLTTSASLCLNFSNQPHQVTVLLSIDSYSSFAFLLAIVCAIFVVVFSRAVLAQSIEVNDEYYVLLLLVVLGAGILTYADHFASLFLGFELLSIAFVGLVGYLREHKLSVESGFKYLVLSATASSFMLMGIAFIYSQTGQLSFKFANPDMATELIFYQVGVLLLFVGVLFKLSIAPFHLWTPDIYQGAPASVTMMLATVSKVAMFMVLVKFWFELQLFAQVVLKELVSFVAILSMLIGNILALKQHNVKRLLAYSSIAHMGYLLIVLIVTSSSGIVFVKQSLLFYLAAYVVATLSLFSVIIILSIKNKSDSELNIDNFSGLFWLSPMLSGLAIFSILSLAGIPLTMGFIGKFYILSHATITQSWGLISALIIGSAISLFYYLKLIFVQFANTEKDITEHKLLLSHRVMLSVLATVSIVLGIYPDFLSAFLQNL